MIYFQWAPSPYDLAVGLTNIANELKDMSDPLRVSIVDVIAPSLQDNFDVGGRPKWAPLASYTIEKKGFSSPLIETGNLRAEAGKLSSWTRGSQEAVLNRISDYGIYQNSGFFNVLFNSQVESRQWATYQSRDIDEIVDIWIEWLGVVIEDAVP